MLRKYETCGLTGKFKIERVVFFLQVKNLPIKSPKVPTLKKALQRFHQTREKNSKTLVTKLVDAALKDGTEPKEGEAYCVF